MMAAILPVAKEMRPDKAMFFRAAWEERSERKSVDIETVPFYLAEFVIGKRIES
jgi:hypothetical protein